MIGPKLLIDTNILIGLEDHKAIASQFAVLHQKCAKYGVQLFIHEASKQDIARDKDVERRQMILSKIDKFPLIEGIPIPTLDQLQSRYGRIKNSNDHVDVILLHSLHEINAVDFLVTQDRNLHKRAQSVGVADRLFRVEDAVIWLRNTYDRIPVALPYIEEKQCQQINRSDQIFETLREDYAGFDNWFLKSCVKSHRECWTIHFDNQIAGIAIRKDESFEEVKANVPSCEEHFHKPPNKILKICTFKIEERFRGEKLGEQLIKQILWWSYKNNYELVYLTVYPKHKYLIDMLQQYGFEMIGRSKGEIYLGKVFAQGVFRTPEHSEPVLYHRQYYPAFLKDERVGKYLIPIKGEYYESLFPENINKRQRGLFDDGVGLRINKIPGNTIRKVYVCHAGIKCISPGDILLFFHLQDHNSLHSQTLITVGIVDGFDMTCEAEEILKLTAKRSVFSPDQLTGFTSGNTKQVKVINFLLAGHINPSISYDRLKKIGIKGPYQSIRAISHEQFESLEREMHLDVKTS